MNLKYLPFLLLSVFALISCSDDDDDPVVRPVQTEKHFKGAELELKVSGNAIVGKDILFTPDETNPKAATLTFSGERFNVEEAMNKGNRANNKAEGYTTSSVFAGEPTVTLPIAMTLNGDMGTFEGNGESKYYTFNYKGTVLDSHLAIELSEVTLKNQKLAGTAWKLEPIVMNDWGMVESIPMTFEWESEKKLAVDMFGQTTEYSMSQIMALVMSIGIVPGQDGNNMTIPEIVASMLQGVQFEGNGDLIATYVDMKTKQPATSPRGIAQYVVLDDTNMRLILNPFAIAANASQDKKDEESSQVSEIMKGLTPMILESLDANRRLAEGVEIGYALEGDKLYVNIDQNLLLPVLKTFAPMLQNPDLIKTILEKAKQNPNMAAMAPMLESVLKQLPEVINTTSKMEIGLKFVKR